jgi:O-6-methylguanine DNA methyltransferase
MKKPAAISNPMPKQLGSGRKRGFVNAHLDLPLDIRATVFQIRAWNYLQTIPYGEVQLYGEVAAGIGNPSATRAVARACAANTVGLVIPCHRVIRGTGELGGYRRGSPGSGRNRSRTSRQSKNALSVNAMLLG